MARGPKGSGVEIRDNNIQISFWWRGKRHRERLNVKPTPGNLKAAARLRAEVQEKCNQGSFDYAQYFPDSKHAPRAVAAVAPIGAYSFREMARRWLRSLRDEKEKGTRVKYQQALEYYWNPLFGDMDVRELKASIVKEKVASLGWDQRSAKTRNNALISLRGVFGHCIADEILTDNPARLLKNKKVQPKRCDPFTVDEVKLVLGYMQAQFPETVWNYFTFALFTGMRPEEMLPSSGGTSIFVTDSLMSNARAVSGKRRSPRRGGIAMWNLMRKHYGRSRARRSTAFWRTSTCF